MGRLPRGRLPSSSGARPSRLCPHPAGRSRDFKLGVEWGTRRELENEGVAVCGPSPSRLY